MLLCGIRTTYKNVSNSPYGAKNYEQMNVAKLISVNFNLRKPSSKKATPLYMVMYYWNDKGMKIQAKIPTGYKVHPSLWDSKRQLPIMYSKDIVLSIKQLEELSEITSHITQLRILAYQNNFCNFDFLKENVNKQSNNSNMSPVSPQFIQSKRTPKATKMLKEYLKKYAEDRKVKNTSLVEYQNNIKIFCEWINVTNQTDSAKCFSQTSFVAFISWLRTQGSSAKKINKMARVIGRLIKYIASTPQGAKCGVVPVTFTPMKEEEKKQKCEILPEEIDAFKNVEVKNDKERYYKDLFLLQIATGQRISDTLKLIKGEYEVSENTIILTTIKRETKAYISETKEVTELLEKIKTNPENKVKSKKDKGLGNFIKVLSARAGLTRITPNGMPLYKEISSHYARHTFVTQRLREGYNFEQVGKMIGDTPLMIERIYGHPSDIDIINSLKLQPAAANTPSPQVSSASPVITKVEKKPLSKKVINQKLLHLKEIYERKNDFSLFELDFFGSFSKNEYIKVYNILLRNVFIKLNKDNNDIMYMSDKELINMFRFFDNDLNLTKEEKIILYQNTNDAEEIIAKCKILFEIWLT